tara:strand:- start:162 stop:557 length:396 start_codon:yes stop_codon:yes gene_type:complete
VLTDPVADMLTRIRNANQALQETVEMPSSRLRSDIAQLLQDEGYIESFQVKSGSSYDTLLIVLRFGENRERVINGLKRVSKPGHRIYARKERLPRVLGGMGTAVISTSKGIMTGRRAEELGIGGEVLCFVW